MFLVSISASVLWLVRHFPARISDSQHPVQPSMSTASQGNKNEEKQRSVRMVPNMLKKEG